MTDDDLLDKYLEMYYYELEHREAINGGLGIATGVVGVLAGGLLFYFREGPKLTGSAWEWAYFSLVGLSSICLATAIYFFGRSWFGRRYFYITSPAEVEAWRARQQVYHDAHADEQPTLQERLRASLIAQVANITTQNRKSNKIKSEFAFLGRAWTLAALALMLLNFLPYAVLSPRAAQAAPAEGTVKTEIDMNGERNKEGQSDAQPVTTTTTLPEKEPFPQPDSFREGSRDTERKTNNNP